jgi:hypothetical protein
MQYHLSPNTILASPYIRSRPGSVWVLRVDVEALAWQLYQTRAFHYAHVKQMGKPCSLCAITRFAPEQYVNGSRSKAVRQIAKIRSPRRVTRH